METHNRQQKNDLKVLVAFVTVFCTARHQEQEAMNLPEELAELFRREVRLCPECRALLDYALLKRRNCPLEPKPSCKHCHIHCYGSDYRERIREIMAFSGRRMIMRGRLDYLWHYFF